jgi:7,8-dihydroneopterin aldolase/epimerase/oxygenase
MKHTIHIQDFEVWVSLGCAKEEQAYSQPVHFNLTLEYDELVKGAVTDDLQDATDYVALADIIKKVSQSKSFHLIEHLNEMVLNGIIHYLKSKYFKGHVKLSIKKIRVPVENLRNGVVFTCDTRL